MRIQGAKDSRVLAKCLKYGIRTTEAYLRSLYIGYGSVCALEPQILLSGDLAYAKERKLEERLAGIAEVEWMLKALIRSLENRHSTP